MDPDDGQLLHRYINERSQDAFAALVHRHFGFVHRAAWRQVGGDGRLVDDVAQSVFIQLARKAPVLTGHPSLAGWLHTTTRYTAARAMRSETRRQLREMAAEPPDDVSDVDRAALRAVLDKAIAGLSDDDREAVLLKYFEGRTISEVAGRVRSSESAAYKRLERALEKLRSLLMKEGIASSGTALAAAMEAEAAVPIAPGIATAAAMRAATVGLSTAVPGGQWAHVIQFMTASKAGIALAGFVSALAVGSAFYEARQADQERTWLAAAQQSLAAAAKTHEADVARQRGLASQAAADEQKWADLQKEVDGLKAEAAAARHNQLLDHNSKQSAEATRAKLLANGKAFLTAFPQARELLMQISRVAITRDYATFIRMANLTPDQIDNLVSATAQQWLDTMTVGPTGVHPADPQLSDEKLQQVLGAQAWQQFKNFQRMQPLLNATTELSLISESAPLSPAQTDQLLTTLANASSSYQTGGKATPGTVDWNEVAAQASGFLSAPQLSALQYEVQMAKLGILVTKFESRSRPSQR